MTGNSLSTRKMLSAPSNGNTVVAKTSTDMLKTYGRNRVDVFFAWCLNTWYLSNTAVNTLLVFCLRTNIISYTFRSAVRIQVSAHLHMTFDNTYTALVLASIVNLRCCGKVNLRSECKEKMTPNLGRFGRLLGLPVFTFFN